MNQCFQFFFLYFRSSLPFLLDSIHVYEHYYLTLVYGWMFILKIDETQIEGFFFPAVVASEAVAVALAVVTTTETKHKKKSYTQHHFHP